MAGVGPLDLAGAVEAVARILAPAQVRVVGLDGRHAYPYESTQAGVTVSVHLDSWSDVDQAGDLLGLDPDSHPTGQGLYSRAGDWRPGVYLSLYGPAPVAASVAGVG
jgi:hypothetical protein